MAEAAEKASDSIKVLGYDDFYAPMTDYLEHDGYPGLPTCFRSLNEHYTHKQGGVTDWTGFPASGKTYFALEVLMGLSERYGKRHGLYVPDLGSDKETMQKLIKMRCGKDFSNKYQNKITEAEFSTHLNWILEHFYIFKKKDFKQGITPLAFWEKVIEFRTPDGHKLDTGLADSWKNFKHLYSGREDSYLDEMLSIRNELSEDNQVHFHTIAHAVKPAHIPALGKGETPKRKVPTADEIKGGGAWNANGKSIITVDWPDKNKTGVDLYINKVKPEDVGKIGAIQGKIKLDFRKGRYYETIGIENYFSYKWQDIPVLQEIDFTTSEMTGAEIPF